MKLIDLHVHTTSSDGTFSPKQVINYALKTKMKAVAITDHNTVLGIDKALKYAKQKTNLEVVPGIELCCREDSLGLGDIHVLGLFINHRDKLFLDALKKQQNPSHYLFRVMKIFLKKTIFANLLTKIAAILRKHSKDALKKPKLSLRETISLIKGAGGIVILAHPGIIKIKKLKKIIEAFILYGGEGLEANYPYDRICLMKKNKSDRINKLIKKIALEKHLAISGGSDFHGYGRKIRIGDEGITEEEFKKLKLKVR
ncbi:MAG TPA: PHP domain-containing protein [Candidatus Nanoarchaeia archaeon]|nr:PHP domain-containing protein [Candidatus Nanoarchaeia archaeon]